MDVIKDIKVEVKTESKEEVVVELPGMTWKIDSSEGGVLHKNVTGTSWVFRGTFNHQNVAIKRVSVDEVEETKPNVLIGELDHRNVVKLFHIDGNDLFKFFILERCAASLQGYFDQDYTGPMPSDVQVLSQLSRGLDYIHSKGLVYCKIKPENILVSLTTPVVMKWADFGLTKLTDSSENVGSAESLCWMVPEVLAKTNGNEICAYSKESDIFSAGCVYFYFLTRAHPFGKKSEIKKNILEGKTISVGRLANDHFANAVVVRMMAKEPTDRITLAEVMDGLKPKPIPPQPFPLPPSPPAVVASPPATRYLTGAEITPISGLEIGVNSGTIHARVISKPKDEVWQRNSAFNIKFFTMHLRDDTGEIKAKAFGDNFQRFFRLFQLGRVYAIKRATMKLDNRGERELSLVKATTVERL